MFRVEIETGNAAFDENLFVEVARILQEIAFRIQLNEEKEGTERDINGNMVAAWIEVGD